MKNLLFPLLASAALISQASAQLLFSDNFDTPDNASFDAAPTDGRLGGTLATAVVLRSWGAQQQISNNQLLIPAGGDSGVRFEDPSGTFGAANRFNWAAGDTGASIISAGGFVVSFDWTPVDNTSTNWISYQVGTVNADSGNLTDDDYGILFRQNGNTERFDNTVNLGAGGAFSPLAGGVVHRVEITYVLTSFADGDTVTATATVDGTEVASDSFTWDGNGGAMHMELGNNDAGNIVDNLQVSTIDTGGFAIRIASQPFYSSAPAGSGVGTLSAKFNGADETAVFTFATGAGDADNTKFLISGDQLQIGSGFDFLDEPDGAQYMVRIGGLGDTSGESGEQSFSVAVIADGDADNLPDSYELAWTGNLADLDGDASGPGPGADTGDFDGDTLTDLEEFELGETTFPGIDPTLADTDADTLDDNEEIAGAGLRPATSPVNPDSDGDSLTDAHESNSGSYDSATAASDSGTNPMLADTDADGYRDAFEILRGGNPIDPALRPIVSSNVEFSVLTDDATSEIDGNAVYTHAISGGGAATINGVTLEALTDAEPANFLWDTGGLARNVIAPINNGDWNPALGGTTGPGLLDLLGGFVYSAEGSTQSYTLSGLTAGESYLLRVYVRLWDTESVGRAADLSFTNGAQTDYAPLLEDRPAIVLGDPAATHAAYAVDYRYTAAGSDLIMTTSVPVGADAGNGSFHLYGLTNQSSSPTGNPEIEFYAYDPATGFVNIEFSSTVGKSYRVSGSGDLQSWFALLQLDKVESSSTEADVDLSTFFDPLPDDYFFRVEEAVGGGD
ncbi:MAG: hypothetical protein ACI9MB_004438 [Verrucomicrobiales bacterium]|jgi:hypothetical protein